MSADRVMVERAAEGIVNARGARRDAPVLTLGEMAKLTEFIQAEVCQDAEAALEAVGVAHLRQAAGEALTALEAIGREPWVNGMTWAECGPVWNATRSLRRAIAVVDGAEVGAKEGGQA